MKLEPLTLQARLKAAVMAHVPEPSLLAAVMDGVQITSLSIGHPTGSTTYLPSRRAEGARVRR